ncbi:hypothetical protein PILCRDRAFT_534457 [Piloderma croceum F 1598]|uniref:Uncharacterized protein n=1 Tax=Piloderma croceum (strain F 1598) TaxID=765440 RepID=A0A0C3BT12_PILCF|nr:hypothetical protein PILCRDRAFT_534457 [Piloderma croceum F 1598]
MQTRRPSAVPPLAIILPHPPLPRRRSSRSLLSAASPHTPRSCASPTCSSLFFAPSGNRKSTDSWNSSNQDGEDDQEWDWKTEHTLLLSRTLDALPSHLLTPFNGPVPPSNLLDKIARGVSHAKGPNEWPHSIRATRAKLLELARIRAKEAAEEKRAKSIAEEDDDYSSGYFGDIVLQPTTNTPASPRKPLYRRSSMDFIASAKLDLKDNDNLSRLSNRLQRTERIIPTSSYHPYQRPYTRSQARSESPTDHSDSYPPRILTPSTPSSTTLYSGSSSSDHTRFSRPTKLHRASTLSSTSSTSDQQMQPPDPRVQRIRHSDSFCGPPLDKPQSLKRAPSFSASSVLSKNAASAAKQSKYASANVGRESISPCPSSDEEEKIRSKKAKKPRVVAASKTSTPTPTVPSTPLTATTTSPRPTTRSSKSKPKPTSNEPAEEDAKSSQSGSGSSTCKSGSTVKKVAIVNNNGSTTAAAAKRPTSSTMAKPRANLQRNPSIFGAPLPQPQVQPAAETMRPPSTVVTAATAPPAPTPAATTTATPQTKTLRRVKVRPANFARRISFGSLAAPSEPQSGDVESRRGCFELGSAFQLH